MNEPCRILLADDEETFCHAATDVLHRAGYECTCVADTATAAQALSTTRYDQLILDTGHANHSHLPFAKKVNDISPGLPIVLVTRHPTVEAAADAVQLSAMAYLIKPIDSESLLDVTRQSILRSRLYRMVTDMRLRLRSWDCDIGTLEQFVLRSAKTGTVDAIRSLMHATFDGVAKSMVDLRRIVEVLTAANQEVPQNDLAELVNRLNVTRDAVRDTINVLEESKRAFKSKRLGELRRQLQSVLNFLEQE